MDEEENQIIGAIKIKDGLFIGDEFAAKVIPKYIIKPIIFYKKHLKFSIQT